MSFLSSVSWPVGLKWAFLSLLLDSLWTWLAVWESDVWTEQLNMERVNSVGGLSFKCVWIPQLDSSLIIQTLVSIFIWNSLSSAWVKLFDSYQKIFELELFLFIKPLDQMWIENVTALRMKFGSPKDVPKQTRTLLLVMVAFKNHFWKVCSVIQNVCIYDMHFVWVTRNKTLFKY